MDNFLNALSTANAYKDMYNLVEATAAEKAAQVASKATANIDQQKYQKCIAILQKYANGQVPEWNQNDIDVLLKTLNDAGFSDKALQKINPMLNSAKKQLNASQSQNNGAQQNQQQAQDTNATQNTTAQETAQNNTANKQQSVLQKGAEQVNSTLQQKETPQETNAAENTKGDFRKLDRATQEQIAKFVKRFEPQDLIDGINKYYDYYAKNLKDK